MWRIKEERERKGFWGKVMRKRKQDCEKLRRGECERGKEFGKVMRKRKQDCGKVKREEGRERGGYRIVRG